jgi:hypothetical protein
MIRQADKLAFSFRNQHKNILWLPAVEDCHPQVMVLSGGEEAEGEVDVD